MNNVQHTRSEQLMEKYKMIQDFKTKTNIVISGILHRIWTTDVFYDKAFSTKALCSQESVEFITMWDDLYEKSELFLEDGLHLSCLGSARLDILISNNFLFHFWQQKNRSTVCSTRVDSSRDKSNVINCCMSNVRNIRSKILDFEALAPSSEYRNRSYIQKTDLLAEYNLPG